LYPADLLSGVSSWFRNLKGDECTNLKRQLQVDDAAVANEFVMQMQILSTLHEDILRMLKVEH